MSAPKPPPFVAAGRALSRLVATCRAPARRSQGALLLPLLLLLAGCGHPATKQECEVILERSAELELRGRDITDPEIIKRRVAAAREAKRDKLMELCIGRRITDSAMTCIRNAGTSEDLEACLK